ncbi:MAG: acyltransferase [Bacteroidales bacterium]|nr:acyltransferase [Bacteroidales bacterium]
MNTIINTRQSNIELLRVISMLFILLVHSNYMGILQVYESPYNMGSFMRFLIESIAIVGVNCFILISGYFGIKLKKEKFAHIIFQIYFFSLLGLALYIAKCGVHEIPSAVLKRSLFPLANYIWFIPCYLLLMMFSPLLNAWLQQTSKKHIFFWIVALYVITYYWSIIWSLNIGFGGYSFGFFIILYAIGHLIRRCKESTPPISPYKYLFLAGYIFCVIVLLIVSRMQYTYPVFKSLLWSYDCPIVLLQSIFLFMFFSNLNIQNNKVINFIGKSSFAVLLVHVSPVSTYNNWLQQIDENYQGVYFILLTVCVILGYYIVAVFIDQLRLYLWNKYLKRLFLK